MMKTLNLEQAVEHVEQLQVVDYLIPRKTVEKLSGLSRATIYRLIKAGKFPRPLSIGTGSVRWRQSDIISWQRSLRPNN
jgi:prophage regulatory protein